MCVSAFVCDTNVASMPSTSHGCLAFQVPIAVKDMLDVKVRAWNAAKVRRQASFRQADTRARVCVLLVLLVLHRAT